MAYEQRPGSGSLFKNRNRDKDTSPNLVGAALLELEGKLVEVGLSAWTKESPKAGSEETR
jgi:hypothetical protein